MNQLLLAVDTTTALVAAPPLQRDGAFDLPERVLCLALDQPYASLLFGDDPGDVGMKSVETRTWEWSYPPSWLAVYATKNPDRAAYRRIYGDGWKDILAAHEERVEFAAILGLVWIGGCRPMRPEDEQAAKFPHRPDLFAWTIGAAYRFPKPNRDHLRRGPQKFVYIQRDVIVASFATTSPVPPATESPC